MATTQTVDKKQELRKTAPDIVVAKVYGKRPMEQLSADNPDESFMRVPMNSSKESLASRGLEPVMVGGKPLERKGYAIARRVNDITASETKAEYDDATEQVSAVRKLEVSDAQAYDKKPTPSGR